MKSANYIVTNQDIYDCVNGTNGGDPLGRTWTAKTTIPQNKRALTHTAVQALVELDTSSFETGWSGTEMVTWDELTPAAPTVSTTYHVEGYITSNSDTVSFVLKDEYGTTKPLPSCTPTLTVFFTYHYQGDGGFAENDSVHIDQNTSGAIYIGGGIVTSGSITDLYPRSCGEYTFDPTNNPQFITQ